MSVKLDLRDKKLLWELDMNSRQILGELAKKLSLSKEAVYYRIKNLENRKIITGYTAVIALNKLGLQQVKLLIKFSNVTKAKKDEIIDYLKWHKNTNWVASCYGTYDLIAGFVVRDLYRFNEIKGEFLNLYSSHVLNADISIMLQSEVYGKKHFLGAAQEKKLYLGKLEKMKLEKIDFDILKLLSKDARMKIVDMASALKTTARIAMYRLKQLEKNEVIQKYTISINHELLGISFFKSFVYLSNTKDKKHILNYFASNDYCYANVEALANWNFEPEFEVYSNDEYYRIINELEDKFGESVKMINTVLISKEHKFELLPSIEL